MKQDLLPITIQYLLKCILSSSKKVLQKIGHVKFYGSKSLWIQIKLNPRREGNRPVLTKELSHSHINRLVLLLLYTAMNYGTAALILQQNLKPYVLSHFPSLLEIFVL